MCILGCVSFLITLSKWLRLALQNMRTKKKARPRVNSVGCLESAGSCSFTQPNEPDSLDVEGRTLLGNTPTIGTCLSVQNERSCHSRGVTGHTCTDAHGSIAHGQLLNQGNSSSFDGNYKFSDTNTMMSCQPFESIPHVTDGEGFTQNAADIGYVFNGAPEQITSTITFVTSI